MRRLMGLLVAAIVAAAAVILWLLWLEPRMLYYAARTLETTPASRGWAFEDVRLRASDGVGIHGWWVPAPAAEPPSGAPRLTALFLHGNAGNISHRIEKLRILRDLGLNVFIIDYRGYGQSEGSPSEHGIHRDARAAYDHLVGERHIAPTDILIYGESLGSASAAHLAADVPVGGVVLESAFTSAVDVGQSMFPFLPVRWVMRDRFEVESRMSGIRADILVLHSRDDEYFPMRHAQRVVAAAGGRARLVELRGGHNDAFLVSEVEYRRALQEFVAGLRAS